MTKPILLLCGMAVAGIADSGPLTLEQALELARNNSPELRAARLDTHASEKAVRASGRWESPRLEFEAEGVGGDLDGFDETEYTLGIVQKFQRGGKQKGEREAALKVVDMALNAEAEKELVLLAGVRQAFIEIMAQQEIDKVRKEQEQLARAFVEVARRRLEAGGGSELEVVQAELALEETILSQTCCFGDLVAAREKLASLINVPEKDMGNLSAPYYALDPIENLSISDSHPALQRLDSEIEFKRAQARLAKAQDSADVTLGAGYRYEAATDANTFVFGASMPLNFTRRGRALQASTLLQADALQAGREELQRRFQQELAILLAQYDGSRLEVEATRDKLMPKAEQAYDLSRKGYEAGRFSWFELIASQQNLADIRIRYIESLRDAHLARAQISKFMKEEI